MVALKHLADFSDCSMYYVSMTYLLQPIDPLRGRHDDRQEVGTVGVAIDVDLMDRCVGGVHGLHARDADKLSLP